MRSDREQDARRSRAEVERWCEIFAAQCRVRGLRVTAQRLAVYRAVAEDLSHPSAEAVYARVRTALPMLSPATVYRTLESLEREGLLRRVSTTGGVGRFDANLEPHQHLVCRVCGRMMDHFTPALAATPLPENAVPGFVIEALDIRLVGRCDRCRGAAGPGPFH
jgi:Fur family transcriptional regulator, peroxide stress response regulator